LANNLANAIIYLTKVRKQKFAHANPIHVLWHHHPNVLFRQPTEIAMNPYIKKVQTLDNHCLKLWFENGEQKIFDLKPYLNKGVFSQLKSLSLFASVRVVAGSIEWSNGIDLSYDTLYLQGSSLNLTESLLPVMTTL